MRSRFVGRWIVGTCLWVAAATSHAAPAEPGPASRWLVVPASVGPIAESLDLDAEVVRQVLAERGLTVWKADRASERFEVLGSAPAPRISQSDIDRWVERSRAAVRYLARADYKAARRELKAAQRVADRAAAELNREAARAQQVLDTCLFMVRAYVETRNGAEARRQARECRRLVPRVEPTAFRHTPEVRDLLAEVDREMATEAPGSLAVRSTPPDCVVRINGVEFGRTPVRDVELPVGTYRLQVECEPERRGRIHRIAVESGANEVSIDVALDLAVRTRPELRLWYASVDAWTKNRMHDAAALGRILNSSEIVVVSREPNGVVRVDMDDPPGAASVWLATHDGGLEPKQVQRAVDALLEGRSVDFAGPQPIARASWRDERTLPGARADGDADRVPSGSAADAWVMHAPRPRGQRIAGWSLFAVGVASIGTSLGVHVRRGTLGDRFVDAPADLGAGQSWQDIRVPVWTLAAVGGAATTAGMPLLLPNRARTPWWGWTLGATGLGLGAYAIYEGVTLTRCPSPFITDESAVRDCVDRGQEAGRVALSAAGAAPLLSVPLVYLLRPLRMSPTVSANRTGAMLRLRGWF